MASATVNIALVPVGDVGNAADTTGYGAVNYAYNIGQYDVTVGQYTAFLNAVASTSDPYSLYNPSMGTDINVGCGITQTPITGGYTYASTKNGNFPVNYVSWGDAARFCNWLSNGQPTAAEGAGTTETGSYTLNGATSNADLMAITRNAGAEYVIPTGNEWYKAAYYDPSLNSGAGGYWLYPTKSNTAPSNVLSATGTNNANFYGDDGSYTGPDFLTPVGAFADSPSAYGTFDQGGDVFQWDETTNVAVSFRGVRGGSFDFDDSYLQSGSNVYAFPSNEYNDVGFRVAQVPEPASVGILGLGFVGLLARRRRR